MDAEKILDGLHASGVITNVEMDYLQKAIDKEPMWLILVSVLKKLKEKGFTKEQVLDIFSSIPGFDREVSKRQIDINW
jgi:hypothetical protein